MRFTCPSCSKAYRLSRDRLGSSGQAKIRCPNCKIVVRVTAGAGEDLACTLVLSGAHQSPTATRKSRPPKATGAGAAAGRAAPRKAPPREAAGTPSRAKAAANDTAVWHIAIQKKAHGPMTRAAVAELLGSGRITAGSLAWRKGQDGWKRLREIEALAALLAGADRGGEAGGAVARRTLPATSQPTRSEVERSARDDAPAEDGAKSTLRSPSATPRRASDAADEQATVMADVVQIPEPSGKLERKPGRGGAPGKGKGKERGGKERGGKARPKDRDPTRKELRADPEPVAPSVRSTVPVQPEELDALDDAPTVEQAPAQERRGRRGRRGKRGRDARRDAGRSGGRQAGQKQAARAAASVPKRGSAPSEGDAEQARKPPARAEEPETAKKSPRDARGSKAAKAAKAAKAPKAARTAKPPQAAKPAVPATEAARGPGVDTGTKGPPKKDVEGTSAPKKAGDQGREIAGAAAGGEGAGTRADKGRGAAGRQPPSVGDEASVQVAGQTASFFETGQSFMSDVDFALPDPNKHKPTKEEYNSLLQEFSVMFRLDKRTKRQKWAIAIVLTSLLLGVIAFGVILVVQGEQRKNLIRDSKTILAVFSLPYQTSVTVRVGANDKDKGAVVSTSRLAGELQKKLALRRKKIRGKRASRPRPGGRVALHNGMRQGGLLPVKRPQLTRAQIEAQDRAAREAIARQLGAMGGRQERVVGVKAMTTDVTTRQLQDLCRSKRQDLYVCGQRFAQGAAFKAVLTVGDTGRVDKVKALVDGAHNAALSRCAAGVFARTKFGLQSKKRTHSCVVGG